MDESKYIIAMKNLDYSNTPKHLPFTLATYISIINNLNQESHESSTFPKPEGEVGGKKEKCKVLKNVSQKQIERQTPLLGEDSVDLAHELKDISRLNCPKILNPKNSTFLDIAMHAKLRQRLSLSTIEKNLRYARFMENHNVSVDFRNPSRDNFMDHMDYREEVENAGPHALRHEWKTMKMFLRAWGMEKQWQPYKAPPIPCNDEIVIPSPDTVHKFFDYRYSDDAYEDKLYQYIFYIGFLVGMRPPSEIANMNLENIHISDDGGGSLTIVEEKKHGRRRTIIPEKYILSSPTRKSLKNWITKWRPMAETSSSGNAVFLTPQGKRFSVRYLGKKLRQNGQKVWPEFHPYTMRHWCATARLIEWNFNINRVKYWMGHAKIDTTLNYLHIAQEYYGQDQSNWLKRAIISRPKKSGDESKATAKKSKVGQKKDFWLKSLREVRMGPAGFEPATNWL